MIRELDKFTDKVDISLEELEAIIERDDIPAEDAWSAVYDIVERMNNDCTAFMDKLVRYNGFKARNKDSLIEID